MKPHVLMIGTATPRMIEALEAHCVVHKAWEKNDLDAFLGAHSAEIAGVSIYGANRIDAALIDRLANLKIISNYGVGYDAIDVPHAVKKGIVVTHTPNVLNRDVASPTPRSC
jgi:lactate dehydrogenase-like 2-hydroxyacid dehydrogenase